MLLAVSRKYRWMPLEFLCRKKRASVVGFFTTGNLQNRTTAWATLTRKKERTRRKNRARGCVGSVLFLLSSLSLQESLNEGKGLELFLFSAETDKLWFTFFYSSQTDCCLIKVWDLREHRKRKMADTGEKDKSWEGEGREVKTPCTHRGILQN